MLEIEIKSLLGSPDKADELKANIAQLTPAAQKVGEHSQLNHYFTNVTPQALKNIEQALASHFNDTQRAQLQSIITQGRDPSVRTRQADATVLFIIKASIDDTTSSNGIARTEFEQAVDMTLEQLDTLLLGAGLMYQAKWSRDRQEYTAGDVNITIDRNAGYGYLAEFEKVVGDDADATVVQQELRDFMAKLDVQELAQDRLERMFDFYNKNWKEYYGTDKIFTIE